MYVIYWSMQVKLHESIILVTNSNFLNIKTIVSTLDIKCFKTSLHFFAVLSIILQSPGAFGFAVSLQSFCVTFIKKRNDIHCCIKWDFTMWFVLVSGWLICWHSNHIDGSLAILWRRRGQLFIGKGTKVSMVIFLKPIFRKHFSCLSISPVWWLDLACLLTCYSVSFFCRGVLGISVLFVVSSFAVFSKAIFDLVRSNKPYHVSESFNLLSSKACCASPFLKISLLFLVDSLFLSSYFSIIVLLYHSPIFFVVWRLSAWLFSLLLLGPNTQYLKNLKAKFYFKMVSVIFCFI